MAEKKTVNRPNTKTAKPAETARVDLQKISRGVRLILEGIGEDASRAGLRDTPQRTAVMFAELTAGMHEDPTQHVRPLTVDKHDESVIVRNISMTSICVHHLAPFVGNCQIA